MINIPCKVTQPLDRSTVGSLNQKITLPLNKSTVSNLNKRIQNHSIEQVVAGTTGRDRSSPRTVPLQQQSTSSLENNSATVQTVNQRPPEIQIPPLQHLLHKGQKTSLSSSEKQIRRVQACFGWNINDARCDLDASAFLVKDTGKVPGDDWFVFYGQTTSPDDSVRFYDTCRTDREMITVDFEKMNPNIRKVIFVITINEAFENGLNFSMVRDAYIRLMDVDTNQEIISYKLEEYYPNVTSMTVGELYLHNGQWKFNPVGNGVNQDLAGQCAIYGVEISG